MHHRLLFSIVALLLWLSPRLALAQTDETLVTITVLDDRGQGVGAVTITATDTASALLTATSDAAGVLVLGPFPASAAAMVIQSASAGGVALTIEPTTETELRLGLIPGQNRPVVLRLAGAVLAVEPATLFAGVNEEGLPNPVEITVPGTAIPGTAIPDSALPMPVPEIAIPAVPTAPVSTRSRWGVIILIIAVAPLLLLGMTWWIRQRRARGSR